MKNLWLLIAFAMALGFALKFFAFEVFTVPTDSMEPTIKTGSKVWLNKIKLSEYKRGDIIGFSHGNENFVKRITGKSRDYITWLGGKFYCSEDTLVPPPIIEGMSPVDEIYLKSLYRIPRTGDSIKITNDNFDFYKPLIENSEHVLAGKILNKIFINNKEANYYVFKQNYYFVEGDNKTVSIDSRTFGLISENQIIGKVLGKK